MGVFIVLYKTNPPPNAALDQVPTTCIIPHRWMVSETTMARVPPMDCDLAHLASCT